MIFIVFKGQWVCLTLYNQKTYVGYLFTAPSWPTFHSRNIKQTFTWYNIKSIQNHGYHILNWIKPKLICPCFLPLNSKVSVFRQYSFSLWVACFSSTLPEDHSNCHLFVLHVVWVLCVYRFLIYFILFLEVDTLRSSKVLLLAL